MRVYCQKHRDRHFKTDNISIIDKNFNAVSGRRDHKNKDEKIFYNQEYCTKKELMKDKIKK